MYRLAGPFAVKQRVSSEWIREGGGEKRGWMAACAVKPTCGQSSGVHSRRDDGSKALRMKMRSKHRTLGAIQHLILKPQPVHGTTHSVVVW